MHQDNIYRSINDILVIYGVRITDNCKMLVNLNFSCDFVLHSYNFEICFRKTRSFVLNEHVNSSLKH
jgi:hypothetical protein